MTSLGNAGSASPAPAAFALSARFSGGLLQLFENTKCVPLLQAKQGTHVVLVIEGRQQTKGMSAFVSWWLIRTICGGLRPVSPFLVRAECCCLFAQWISVHNVNVTTIQATVSNTDTTQIQMPKAASSSMLLVKAVWLLREESFPGESHSAII